MFEERDDVDFDFDRFDGMCRRNHCSADGSSIPSLISGGRLTRRVEIPSLCPAGTPDCASRYNVRRIQP